MANYTQSDLQLWMDAPPSYEEAPPSYEELFGSHTGKPPEPETPPLQETETVNDFRRQEGEEARKLVNNQNRYLVTDTRANPPEAPHFLNPDQRPWMRTRTEPQSGDSNSRSTGSNTTNTGRQDVTREGTRGNRSDISSYRPAGSVNRCDTSSYRSNTSNIRPDTSSYRPVTAFNRIDINPNRSYTSSSRPRADPFSAEMAFYPQRRRRWAYNSTPRSCTVD